MKRDPSVPDFIYDYVNLASPRLGTKAVLASDEFFAPKERILLDRPAVFIPDKYDDHGKWMDGWETRRRRNGGHDWCIFKLGVTGIVKGIDIDTSHFTGNFPPAASLEGVYSETEPDEHTRWRSLVRTTALKGDSHHYLAVSDADPVNWLRLQIFPDGGVARLRVHGIAKHEFTMAEREGVIELSSLKYGGRVISYNDAHYGNVFAILSEGPALNMGDGWETRRRREPGNDWIIIALGAPAK